MKIKIPLLIVLLFCFFISFAQIKDDFNDNELNTNPEWYGNITGFEVVNPPTEGNGCINGTALNDNHVLHSKSTQGDAVLITSSSIAYGEWQFSVADGKGWGISRTNDYFIILIADDSTTANLKDGASLNFNGYYLRYDGGNSDQFILYKQTGTTKEIILDTDFPDVVDNTNASAGYSVKVTRNITGLWSVYIDSVFESVATTQRGISVTDNTHQTSKWFGISTNIANPSDTRLLYFDNLFIISKDFDSDVSEPASQIAGGTISSLADSVNEAMEVFKFKISDNSSGDLLPSDISTIVIKNAHPVNEADWTNSIAGVALNNGSAIIINSTVITDNQITINIDEGNLQIGDGLSAEITLQIYLHKNNIIDKTVFQFKIDSVNHGFRTFSAGSGFTSVFNSPILSNKISIEVNATQIAISEQPPIVNIYNNFNFSCNSVDVNGNTDFDYIGAITLSKYSGTGNLSAVSGLTHSFSSGVSQWTDIQFTTATNFQIKVSSLNFGSKVSDTLIAVLPFYENNFESGNLNDWFNTGDWIASTTNPINGTYSLKHELSDVAGKSYISHLLTNVSYNSGTIIWRMVISNGNWDPTSANNFAFYLMSDSVNISNDSISAYAVGVNLSGSDDFLKLWKINTGNNFTSVITSTLDWDETNTVSIEISRTAIGLWTLKYALNNQFSNLITAGTAIDNEFVSSNYYGLFFNYSTTRAGKLWCDDIQIYEVDNPPLISKVNIIDSVMIEILFSEIINQVTAENKSNYSISTANTQATTINSVTFDILNKNKVTLSVSELVTDDYALIINNIEDTAGLFMQNETYNFSYSISPQAGDIVINEIMADPLPVVGLPEYDFIELYNTTDYPVYLKNWTITIGDNIHTFSADTIPSDSFLIVCPSSAVSLFEVYGITSCILSTSDLTNAGKRIILKDNQDNTINIVTYSDTWYGDPLKEEGGWSLEKIDPLNNCSTSANWIASLDTTGGTPGRINSVFASNMDISKPLLTSVKIVSAKQLKILFNEILDTSFALDATNYLIDNFVGNPDSVILVEDDFLSFNLYFSNSFPDEDTCSLQIANLQDLCGNIIADTTVSFLFYVVKPLDVVINEIMADPEPSVRLPEYDFLELYNRSKYNLNLNNWSLTIGTRTRYFEKLILPADSFLIITTTSAIDTFSLYGETIGMINSTDLTSTGKLIVLKSNINSVINSVNYGKDWYHDEEKENGGWSIELIDPTRTCDPLNNWAASLSELGGTPGSANTVFSENIDSIPPKIVAINVFTNSILQIAFNENVDITTVLNTENYILPNHSKPDSVFFVMNYSSINVYFTEPFISEISYQISIKNITDNCGNTATSIDTSFTYYLYEKGDVVFNEIMADPLPPVLLPEYEYVEIYNNSDKPINLKGWKIIFDDNDKTLSSYIFEPNTYLLLNSSAADSSFQTYGNTLIVAGFPSLPNSGETITIQDSSGNIIDEINYSASWYHNADKANGGWTFERIDPDNLCGEINNWRASENINGGTPGKINSVFAENIDTVAPLLTNIFVISAHNLVLEFNENLSVENSAAVVNFYVSNSINFPDSVFISTENLNLIHLYFSTPFTKGSTYTISVEKITDLCQNKIPHIIEDFTYSKANAYKIVFNEILADPEPVIGLPNAEFVELVNTTNKNISLNNWTLTVGNSTVKIPLCGIKSNNYLIFTANMKAFDKAKSTNIIEIKDMPSLPNNGEDLILKNDSMQIISAIHYSKDWYQDEAKAAGGYSLELLDPANPTGSPQNWHESGSSNGGTPGFQNADFTDNPDMENPILKKITLLSDSSLQLYFSESLDSTTLSNLSIFFVDNGIDEPSLINLNAPFYSDFTLYFSTYFMPGTIYNLTINGSICDIAGNAITTPAKGKFGIPEIIKTDDIIINEVLFNPSGNGVDYVELYNKTDKTFDLGKLILATRNDEWLLTSENTIDKTGYLFFSNEFIVLTTNQDIVKQQYFTPNPEAFIQMPSMPSFANDKGIIVLMTEDSLVIDEFHYSDELQFPLLSTFDGVALERMAYNKPTNEEANWHSASKSVGYGTPAYENSQHSEFEENTATININPEVFSPDEDGYNDVLQIQYQLSEPDYVANIIIYDSNGRLVKKITQNELLATEGIFTWDGTNDYGDKASIGIYIIYFEIFDLRGNVKKYKKVCVLASKL